MGADVRRHTISCSQLPYACVVERKASQFVTPEDSPVLLTSRALLEITAMLFSRDCQLTDLSTSSFLMG